MHKSAALRITIAVLCAVSVVLIAIGGYGMSQRTGTAAETLLIEMRVRAVLSSTTGEDAVETFVAVAREKAKAEARAAKLGANEMVAALDRAEAEVRAGMGGSAIDLAQVDTAQLGTAIQSLREARTEYDAVEAAAIAAYAEQAAQQAPAENVPEGTPAIDEGLGPADDIVGSDDLADDLLVPERTPVVDLTGFTATPEMLRLERIVDDKFDGLSKAIQGIEPLLDDELVLQLKPHLLQLAYQPGDRFVAEYDRYAREGGLGGISGSLTAARIMRSGHDMVTIGVTLLIFAMILLFSESIKRRMGLPLIIIGSFFIFLCMTAMLLNLSIEGLLSNALVRLGMNSIMVLAMLPAIQCGITLNLGLPLGCIGGLAGALLSMEYGYSGWYGFAFAIVVGLALSAIIGYFYSLLLNRLKGSEMAVTTYVGFSFVALMCIAWVLLPFQTLSLKWPLTRGLRQTISLSNVFRRILDQSLAFRIGGVTVPTGLLLFMAAACLLMWLFSRSKVGIAMQAVGNNPRFAEATGISVDRMRTIGTTLSTMLGAVGILVYSQSYGYIQLYMAPRPLGLLAASAILLGGATTTRARISHVLIGTFLFHSILTVSIPVANELLPGSTIAEILRLLISNGIILYALTKSGGGSRA